MTRGRKAALVPTISWHIQVPIDLAFQVELRLADPVTQKAAYAARSKLIQSLLYEWLKSQGVKAMVPAEYICPECKRPKATSNEDVQTGACPKWLDGASPVYAANCLRHTQADLPLEGEKA